MWEDLAICRALLKRAAQGDAAARSQLVEQLHPVWVKLVRRSRPLGPLAQSEDHVHDVVLKIVEKFSISDRFYAQLVHWQESNPEKSFEDWNRIVVANEARDHVRKHLAARRSPGLPSVKGFLNGLPRPSCPDDVGVRPPFTLVQLARQVAEVASEKLNPQEAKAVRLWLKDASFDDIALELEVSPERARNLMRSAVARLRRHFAATTSAGT